jgi:hypothetical protein
MATVPIPPWSADGLLPAIDAANPVSPQRAPYFVALPDVVMRFGTSPPRRAILRGWLEHRAALHRLGLTAGFQWLDGSFVEDVETLRRRPPNDVDVVSFVSVPPGFAPTAPDDRALEHDDAKRSFKVDAYFVELDLDPAMLASQAAYWYSVWAHTRGGYWKGFLQVDLAPHDDGTALAWLNAADASAAGSGVASP